MTRAQAAMAARLLGLHPSSLYRLRRRFLTNPVLESIKPAPAGPKPGNKRVLRSGSRLCENSADTQSPGSAARRKGASPAAEPYVDLTASIVNPSTRGDKRLSMRTGQQ